MKISYVLSALAIAAAAVSSQTAFAQDKPTGTSMAPAGQGPNVSASSSATTGMSDKSPSGAKLGTKSGVTQSAGQAPQSASTDTKTGDKPVTGESSSKSRESVKSDTKAAKQSGGTKPAGQTPEPAEATPKK